ncbi:hypothetical protein SAMN06265365_108135 [Tistlia consotensis]|uniref:GTP-binding protein n=1 Tax=Tistlia consotensis USBA 355 TaxID=560819 RepID=A0A1Y6BRX4_9PROT|nr:DUF465 domain-containing protein [Tistlia consotensis]SMF23818.1 hypothetical protein SAMN05428998_10845 [Tistlia consotensis USBA 355]SNR61228.1 hypothetical protein SAMN06265365_108135 [Tistlia consotensis]
MDHHDLLHELPEHRATIHALKTGNSHFARLFEKYHELDRTVRNAEERIPATSEEHEEQLKRERLALKDELYAMILEAEGKPAQA